MFEIWEAVGYIWKDTALVLLEKCMTAGPSVLPALADPCQPLKRLAVLLSTSARLPTCVDRISISSAMYLSRIATTAGNHDLEGFFGT